MVRGEGRMTGSEVEYGIGSNAITEKVQHIEWKGQILSPLQTECIELFTTIQKYHLTLTNTPQS
jgi:hypothetical protein